ncbi:hypothetical protein H2198_003586 [Neophaeococcomyces mojaviensis]|uniref:Uncharacterized protein n=1 Tax=Neophaeococcomyces mojaviensis TaxID=3383035 RepID=A0ACC3AAU5_9EURO|nr:hypothetical protein H2198_003586 [Knufia sp. JES_112]
MEQSSKALSESSESRESQELEQKQSTKLDESHPSETAIEPAAIGSSTSPIPDGGLTAWLQVGGGWVVLVATWGVINTFGVYQTYYQTVLLTSSSASSISWIGSLQACLLLVVGLASGPLFDAGYFTTIMTVGLLLISLGMFMTSLCSSYAQVLLAQGVCTGIGMGLTFLPAAAILSQYFKKRRALAVGIAGTGSPVAGIIFPIIFSRLLPKIGFGWATRVIAFIILGLSVIPVVFMRPRSPTSGHIRSIVDNSAWRDFAFLNFTIGMTFTFLVLYTVYFYIEVFDELNHLSDLDFAPYTVTLLSAGSVFGRLLPMYLSDKWGVLNVTTFCTFASGCLAFGWMGINSKAGVIVFTLLYGITSGAVVVGAPVALMALSPDMSRLGARMGMAFTVSGIAVLVGAPIAGAILGDFSRTRWLAMMGYSAGGSVLGTVFMVLSWYYVYKRRQNWKI